MSSLRRFKGHRVVVTTTADSSVKGVLTGVHRDCLEVSAPEVLQEDQAQGVPGVIVVLRQQVDFVQVL